MGNTQRAEIGSPSPQGHASAESSRERAASPGIPSVNCGNHARGKERPPLDTFQSGPDDIRASAENGHVPSPKAAFRRLIVVGFPGGEGEAKLFADQAWSLISQAIP
jgi:hypothetical protein